MHEISTKAKLLRVNSELKELVDAAGEAVPVSSGGMISDWKDACNSCEARLDDDLLRMAVVGTIKSGKSTFINSLFSGDYLKRGAGVITSIVTKVRASDQLRAVLYFKSWDEINAEIEQSLRIFFSAGIRTKDEPFDIRDAEHRQWLEASLESLESKYLLSNDTRNMDHVLLGAYLNGYPDVKDIVSDENRAVVYEDTDFPMHRNFSGSEYLSVFLKDLKLGINAGGLEKNIEIADCQGSDSPNPLHLAMIQDYLYTADLVVYIISSRTGLRQADIKFLSMIKNMAGMNHVLFVLNSDFNEHGAVDDLVRVAGKVREELELIVTAPSIYVFSSLYSLFSGDRNALPEKDAMRLEQWEKDDPLVSFSNNEEARFQQDFRKMITEQRFSILLKNQAHCLNFLISDVGKWLGLSRELLSTDNGHTEGLLYKIGKQEEQTDKVRSMIKTGLDGAVSQLKKEVRAEMDTFFDIRHGELVPGIVEFVRGYRVSYDQYGTLLEKGDFSGALFSAFQAFKQALDRYMAENVNPVLIGFIKNKEDEICHYFESVGTPYRKMILEARGEGTVYSDNRKNGYSTDDVTQTIDLAAIKKNQGLSIPSAAATLDYSGTLRTEAFMKLGFYRFTSAVKKLFKSRKTNEYRDIPALKAGVRRMKKETETSLVFYFKNYRENIKFQYFFKLIDSISEEMLFQMTERFSGYQAEILNLKRMTDENPEIKENTLNAIDDILARLSDVKSKMENIEEEI